MLASVTALPAQPDRVIERSQVVPVEIDEAFAFFADPRNLEAITPPWLGFRILEAPATLEQGSLLGYRLPARPRPWKRTRRSASERAIRCTLRRLETERTRVT